MKKNLKNMGNEKIEQIVLYHGSLDELNSRNPDEQFIFAKDLTFTSKGYDNNYVVIQEGYSARGHPALDFSKMNQPHLKEIFRKGYGGLVNFRTILFRDHMHGPRCAIEGTPIIKKN
jgi:hypothetical protein